MSSHPSKQLLELSRRIKREAEVAPGTPLYAYGGVA